MKALFISTNQVEAERFRRMSMNQFKQVEIDLVNDTDSAFKKAEFNSYGFIIVDVESTDIQVDTVCSSLFDFLGEKPIIFLGKETIINDLVPQELYQMNEYNDRILRPIDRIDIIDDISMKLSRLINWAEQEEYQNSIEEVEAKDFLNMKIKNLLLFKQISYDIYLPITSTQFIKIVHANKKINQSTISQYAKKNIKFLKIRKDDKLKMLSELANKCINELESPRGTNANYILFLKSINTIHDIINTIGVDETVHKLMDLLTSEIVKFFDSQVSIKVILKNYPIKTPSVASKSLLCAFINCQMAYEMDWKSTTTKQRLTACSILQDIDLAQDSYSLVNSLNDPRVSSLAEAQLKRFKEHPIEAAKIARLFNQYPDIDFILEAHHETPTKQGFPNCPTAGSLTTFNAAFNICQYVAASIDGKQITSKLLKFIFLNMETDYNVGNFRDAFVKLRNIITK